MKRWLTVIIVFILAVTAVGCSKTVEQQIGEQLELDQKYLINDDAEAMVFVETASKVISDGYDETDNLFASSKEVLEYLTTTSIESGERNKADGVTQMSQRSGMDIEFTEENGSGYTEEELEKFTAGYRAAMRYPEGRIEKSELFPLNGEYPYDYIHWFVFINDEGGKPNLIDRGDFYEVTNCTIMFPYIVPDEVISQFADGFEFDVSLYDQNGKPDTLHSVVVYKDGDWWLTPDGNTEYEFDCRRVTEDPSGKNVIAWIDYGEYCLGTIYNGSLFFMKNGIVHDYWFSKSGTFEEYVSEELHVIYPGDGKYAWWGGKADGDSVCFNGAVVFDPNTGMIVESVEYGFE